MQPPAPRTLEQWTHWFKHADFQQGLKERALDAISNGVVITDPSLPDNPIIYANAAFVKLSGYPYEEILGRNCRFLQANDRDQPMIAEIRRAIVSAQPVHAVLRNYRKDGSMFWNELFIAPVLDEQGGLSYCVGVQQDVTERKCLELRLAQQVDRLHELDRMKGLFSNSVSHELRTPLSSIKGFAELLADELTGPLNDAQRGFVSQIQDALARLERLVDDLLDMARIEGGTFRLNKQRIDFCAKVRDVVREFRVHAEPLGIALLVECPTEATPIVVDWQRITQVLLNLIGNAVKFSPRGSEVRVCVELQPDGIKCQVVDHGIGISAADLPKLFRPYVQLSSGIHKMGGTGLGLCISKSIVEAHQGRIGVESGPDGSTFWFFLPFESQQTETWT